MQPADEKFMSEVVGPIAEPAPTAPPAAKTQTSTHLLRHWASALRASPWLAVALRTAAIAGFMLGFAAIGAAATVLQTPGVHIASQMAPSAAVLWLAPTPPPVDSTAQAPARATERPALPLAAPTPTGELALHASPDRSAVDCTRNGQLCDDAKAKKTPEGVTSDGKVILNVAGAEALTILPGIGKRRAEAIVKLRERLGRFRRTSDLLRVRGIGVRSLKRMLPHLVLDPPKTEAEPDPKTSSTPGDASTR